MNHPENSQIVELSSKKFAAGCAILAGIVLLVGPYVSIPPWVIAVEVVLTVITLFVLGSIRYRLDKNALTYGAVMVIGATFWTIWWPGSYLRGSVTREGAGPLWEFFSHYFLTLHGLDELVHADTMLFILGLTLFVAVIAQTRLLETISFRLLHKNRGLVVPTVAMIAAVVSVASGILDGVSMIGLMIRTLVIILFLSKVLGEAVIYAVMVSTVTTTVCGMWLAYGEPPNLIMKSNLYPLLDNTFFLSYCLPVAVASYFVVLWNVSRMLRGKKVDIEKLDILDLHTADVRFLQASRHGEVLIPVEFVKTHKEMLGDRADDVLDRLYRGEPLGSALVKEEIPDNVRKDIHGKFVCEPIAENLDRHYVNVASEDRQALRASSEEINRILESPRKQRIHAQIVGGISFIPFIGCLVWHAMNHDVPLFIASFAGFAVAILGIAAIPSMRKLALREAVHEYKEYLFLFPLFFSITLLQRTGFFTTISNLLHYGIDHLGTSHMAYLQFAGTTFLSAMLDNNVVADFAGRALRGLETNVVHLFAMAQIAGYAVGGCWTHIGSAQSVVAYSFIRKEINAHFTPFQWIKSMTPIILEIFAIITLIVYAESYIFSRLQ